MASDSGSRLTFAFDENCSVKIVLALRALGQSVLHVPQELGRGTPDEQWLRWVGERGYSVISYDHRIMHHPHERAVLTEMDITTFFLKGTIRSLCGMTQAIVKNWPNIKRLAGEQHQLYQVTEREVRPLKTKDWK